ncbi:DUF805 domain-containing protein [Veillonella sp.]|uniref:DUF805 domain-containing protein n=1 Tax=Veillonella sp. TaxID=1926307 RepID=UPI0025F3DAD4|nr:DUF805 domain-containing protein [Veillonella sp.]
MFCKYCGHPIIEGDSYCTDCGNHIQEGPAMVSWKGSLDIFANYKMCLLKKPFTIQGRATRAEFWRFMLLQSLILHIINLPVSWFEETNVVIEVLSWVTTILALFSLVIENCLIVRRLHDFNVSGKWVAAYWALFGAGIIFFISRIGPYWLLLSTNTFTLDSATAMPLVVSMMLVGVLVVIGLMATIVIGCIPSNKRENKYGLLPDYTYYRGE